MKTKILIVDDLRENILALSELIATGEVEVFTADSPDRALDLILDHEFALALLDVMMPTMSGFDLARLIRGVERGRHLPIVFVTAHQMEQSVIFEGYESGAVDVMFKPLNPHIVRSKVAVFVRLDQQNRLLQNQVQVMARLKEEAELANIAKSRFLANMSHEIRTPLTAVLGFADVLSQGEVSTEERHEFISSISRNGQLLLRIIDDILDLSRIEAERMELEKIPFGLDELLHDLDQTLSNRAATKGITLTVERDTAMKHTNFIADPLRLKQILLNVIGNAIKFTEKGGVSVQVDSPSVTTGTATFAASSLSASSAAALIRFVVCDSGIGMSREETVRVFEPFAQADGSTRRKFGGTGLGLAISKQLAKAMGGDVKITASSAESGSTFEITISATIDRDRSHHGDIKSTIRGTNKVILNSAVPDSAKSGTLSGKKILVVDDVLDNRVLIERFLRPSGAHIELAVSGAEAIAYVAAGSWDVVLMDIQMPNMDGYETTSHLRQAGFQQPIIALTAHAMREELDRCLHAGCDTTLTKPVTRKDLIAKLLDVLDIAPRV